MSHAEIMFQASQAIRDAGLFSDHWPRAAERGTELPLEYRPRIAADRSLDHWWRSQAVEFTQAEIETERLSAWARVMAGGRGAR
jgi:hypothetical protein